MKAYQVIFRIGMFLSYTSKDFDFWVGLRNFLRSKNYASTFLVSDYPSYYFKDQREKSIKFVEYSHTQFFIFEGDVGRGGLISEFEHYIREVFSEKGKTAVLFERCEEHEEALTESPSSVLLPVINEDKFYIYRYVDRSELYMLFLAAANNMFFKMYTNPRTLLDIPSYRLKCQICDSQELEKESQYICLNRCKNDCRLYHFCLDCYESKKLKCTNEGKEKNLFYLSYS